jgi:glycerol kinase
MAQYILALDQGTTSSRAIVFGRDGRVVSQAQYEFPQILPESGSVEHDPETIWGSQLRSAQEALQRAQLSADDIAAIGVTNQRETTVLWEQASGRPVGNAIVWQSRVSAPVCERLLRDGKEEFIRERTGLVLDPYFSGSKITHLFENNSGLRRRAERGEVLFGTVDSYLIWKLTGGKRHVTDVSNASRTLLFNLHTLDWDDDLLRIFGVPRAMLPAIVPSSGVCGETSAEWFGRSLPIAGIAGDQQAATFGQACFAPGMAKNTYGTGCFLLLNIGDKPVLSNNRLLTTVGWQINGKTSYCLEGAVFVAGAAVQWLRDGLGIIKSSEAVEPLANSVTDSDGVYFVPALVGLGAPYWDPYARGTILGITRGTTAAHIARAALESMALQSCDVLEAMRRDSGLPLLELKVDGGAATNDALLQMQADLLGATVRRPVVSETTALGAAYLAGLAVGYWNDLGDVTANWALDREFHPQLQDADRERKLRQWQRAVERSLRWEEPE